VTICRGREKPHYRNASGKVDMVGKVVESVRPQRLVITWVLPADSVT